MIQSFAITSIGRLTDTYALPNGLPKGVKPSEHTKPAQVLPVIIADGNGRRIEHMKWGFFTVGAKDANSVFRYKTFNVRSEDVFKKPMFEKAIRSQRCIVPVDGFYYTASGKPSTGTHYVTSHDGSLLSLAGVYSSWVDTEGKEWNMFSIVTTTANKDMRTIDNRMPVILPKDKETLWLDSSVSDMTDLYDMMRPYTPGLLKIESAK